LVHLIEALAEPNKHTVVSVLTKPRKWWILLCLRKLPNPECRPKTAGYKAIKCRTVHIPCSSEAHRLPQKIWAADALLAHGRPKKSEE
jgi:hypothetical protein